MKLFEYIPKINSVKYLKPKLDIEWEEAKRYPEFVDMGMGEWLRRGERGYVVNYTQIKNTLGNVDLNFNNLEPAKIKRALQQIENKLVEYPIVVKFSDDDYDLVAGNTRLAALVMYGYDPKLWVVDISDIYQK